MQIIFIMMIIWEKHFFKQWMKPSDVENGFVKSAAGVESLINIEEGCQSAVLNNSTLAAVVNERSILWQCNSHRFTCINGSIITQQFTNDTEQSGPWRIFQISYKNNRD